MLETENYMQVFADKSDTFANPRERGLDVAPEKIPLHKKKRDYARTSIAGKVR